MGPSVGANFELKATTVGINGGSAELSGFGKQNFVPSVSADYGFATGNSSVVLVGGKYDLGSTTALSISGTNNGSVESLTLKEKSHVSLFVAPGMVLNDKTLAYAKVSYETSTGEVAATGSDTVTSRINGFGWGVGIRTQMSDKIYLNVEAMRIDYSAKSLGSSDAKTGSTIGSIGISYKF